MQFTRACALWVNALNVEPDTENLARQGIRNCRELLTLASAIIGNLRPDQLNLCAWVQDKAGYESRTSAEVRLSPIHCGGAGVMVRELVTFPSVMER